MRPLIVGLCCAFLASCGGGSSSAPAPVATTAPTPTPSPSSPTSPGVSFNYEAASAQAIAAGARAVLFLRDGALVHERYANGGGATVPEQLASGTKSFTCLLAAAAEDDGFLRLSDHAGDSIPPWGPGGSAPQNELKQQITGTELIALTAGLVSTGSFGGELNSTDSYNQAFFQPSRSAPNAATIYGPNGFQAFSALFELKTGGRYNTDGTITGGRDGVDYLRSRVFERIGLTVSDWRRDVRGKPNFGGGAAMTARDWLRFGQLMEQDGEWAGQQIVSAARLQRCSTYRSGAFQGYGLAFWLNRPVGDSFVPGRDLLPYTGDVSASWRTGGSMAPSAPADMYVAAGAGPTRLYILPSQNLVIARIGGSEEEDPFFRALYGT